MEYHIMVFQTLCKHFALPVIRRTRFLAFTENVQWMKLWRGDLSPLGCGAALKAENAIFVTDRFRRVRGRYAAQRG